MVINYAVYLDEFGHIGPFFSRKHEKYNQSPVFGLAGFIMPVEKIRNFGTWVFQQKCSMFQSDFDRLGIHPANWEKKGANIYTASHMKKYKEFRHFTYRLFNQIHKMEGHVFYVGTEKPSGKTIDPKKLYANILKEAIKRLDEFCKYEGKDSRKFFLMLDEHPLREKIITEASIQMYGKPRLNLIEPPFQLESHRYQTMQAADWIAALVGRIGAAWKNSNEYYDYVIFRRLFEERLIDIQIRSGIRDWNELGIGSKLEFAALIP